MNDLLLNAILCDAEDHPHKPVNPVIKAFRAEAEYLVEQFLAAVTRKFHCAVFDVAGRDFANARACL